MTANQPFESIFWETQVHHVLLPAFRAAEFEWIKQNWESQFLVLFGLFTGLMHPPLTDYYLWHSKCWGHRNPRQSIILLWSENSRWTDTTTRLGKPFKKPFNLILNNTELCNINSQWICFNFMTECNMGVPKNTVCFQFIFIYRPFTCV